MGRGRGTRRRARSSPARARALALAMAAALAIVALGGCGADAVDRSREVDVLVATCRAIQERTTGRTAAPVDRAVLARALDRRPGLVGDRSLVAVLRQTCIDAQATGGAAPVPFFPPPNEP